MQNYLALKEWLWALLEQTALVVRQGHLVGKLRRTGTVGWEKLGFAKGNNSYRLTLIGMSKECIRLGLGWVRSIVGFNNNHVEDNCHEI